LSDEERLKKIEELKENTRKKKLAISKNKLTEIRKDSANKGITPKSDSEENVFVPLNEEEKAMVAQWRDRLKKTSKNLIKFTYETNSEGKRDFLTETLDEYPVSPTDIFNLYNAALSQATGSNDLDFSVNLFTQCSIASGSFKVEKDVAKNLNGILGALQALKPQDEIEGMLISRLISLHNQGMEYLGRTNNEGQTPQGIDTNVNRSTKLFRLYNETLETLMRYRRKGEQRVIVQHVNVENGGKAIVGGNVIAGGGG
jgi:hypothetical protein